MPKAWDIPSSSLRLHLLWPQTLWMRAIATLLDAMDMLWIPVSNLSLSTLQIMFYIFLLLPSKNLYAKCSFDKITPIEGSKMGFLNQMQLLACPLRPEKVRAYHGQRVEIALFSPLFVISLPSPLGKHRKRSLTQVQTLQTCPNRSEAFSCQTIYVFTTRLEDYVWMMFWCSLLFHLVLQMYFHTIGFSIMAL